MSTKNIPKFIIAGGQKCGTTWLEHNLNKHPQVCTPGRQLHFFDENYRKGKKWYLKNFDCCPVGSFLGEKTTEYINNKTTSVNFSRISNEFPNIKIIIILRNPVERALSAYGHMVCSGLVHISSNPNKVIFEENNKYDFIEKGFYSDQIKSVFKFFPKEQVRILIFERDVINNQTKTWDAVCDFLQIGRHPIADLNEPINKLRLSRISIRLVYYLYNIPYVNSVIRRLNRFYRGKKWSPNFTLSTRRKLELIYENENAKLFNILGYSIKEWKKKEGI
jgi:hypothetical protein